MKCCFVVAMKCEADAITRSFSEMTARTEFGREVREGIHRGEKCALVIAGVGKVNAAAATQLALSLYHPELLVNAGVAGAIDLAMKVGELYAVRRVFQSDFDLSAVNPIPRGSPNEYDSPWFVLESVAGLPSADVATSDSFDNYDRDYDFVRGEMGVSLRDMELGAIAHVAKRAGVPLMAVKSVSDVHCKGLATPADQYLNNLPVALESLAGYFSK